MGLEGEYRLRNHLENRLFFKEELESKLRTYDGFIEGGTRLQIEKGRPTTMAEISVNAFLLGQNEMQQFYFNLELPIADCKAQICSAFGVTDSHTLYRVDAFEEPTYALRRLKIPLVKCNVSSGEMLCLKSDKELLPEEKLKLSIH
jgi:hypothetical protein